MSAMDFAMLIQDPLEMAGSILIPFEGVPFLSGSRFGEPCNDRGILCVAPSILCMHLFFLYQGFPLVLRVSKVPASPL